MTIHALVVDTTGGFAAHAPTLHRWGLAVLASVLVPAGLAQAQTISTVAGTGGTGYNSNDQTATSTALNNPYGVTADADGNFYIAETGNQRVRKVAKAPACGRPIRFCAIPEPMPIDLDLDQLRQPVIHGKVRDLAREMIDRR